VAAVELIATLRRVSAPRSESALKRAVRRLARPVLSPIDGRVADINSRVEWIGDRTEDALQAHAQSASEASSYIGVELRRIQERLAELGEGSLEEYYKTRLASAAGMSLEELDEPLAQAINHATSHQGFYAQAGLWFNPPVVVELSAGAAAAVQVTERIVEVPFAMAALSRLRPGARILDVGSAESTFSLSAASLGYQVTAIDPRPMAYSHPNLESHAALLEDWDATAAPFDAAFLISTIEHVGLGAYGERPYGEAEHGAGTDAALLERVRALLSPGGMLVLTMPYGARDRTALQRIYDAESVGMLLADWEILERRVAVRRDRLVWSVGEDVAPGSRAVVMVIASPRRALDLTSP
jgi:SAM-dependent methyltransferase